MARISSGWVYRELLSTSSLLTPSSSPPVMPISCRKMMSAGHGAFRSETTYHLDPLLHGGSTLQVLGRGLDVPVDGLLRQIDHVRREQGLAVQLEVALILVDHAVQPREQLLRAVIGVKDNGNAVDGRDAADEVSGGNGTGNGRLLVAVGDSLTDTSVFLFLFRFWAPRDMSPLVHHTFPAK